MQVSPGPTGQLQIKIKTPSTSNSAQNRQTNRRPKTKAQGQKLRKHLLDVRKNLEKIDHDYVEEKLAADASEWDEDSSSSLFGRQDGHEEPGSMHGGDGPKRATAATVISHLSCYEILKDPEDQRPILGDAMLTKARVKLIAYEKLGWQVKNDHLEFFFNLLKGTFSIGRIHIDDCLASF